MDISKMSLPELLDLQSRIPQEMKRRELQEKVDVLTEVRAFAKARGYSLEELLDREIRFPKKGVGSVKVKYRHPENPELKWTGRGRQPKWVEAWLISGGTLASLRV